METANIGPRRRDAALAGGVAALFALGVSELLAGLILTVPSLIISIGTSVIDLAPPAVKDFAIETFGTADKPALISLEEVDTLFHEFGHALHGLLSDCTYEKLSGTAVPRDFVELPSQIMENWATHPEVLKLYARHYETGVPIPDKLVAKITAAKKFNQGFATVEYLAASYLDMDYHTLTDASGIDIEQFEAATMDTIGLIDDIIPRYRSSYFQHVFSDGSSSGYYSYIWSEVLDKDAFNAFLETSLYDQTTATAFRTNILEKGGSVEEMEMYLNFRGKEPTIEPLLKGRGLN